MAVGDYVPNRGDIVFTNFDPAAGNEQAHKRPALVLSIAPFNKLGHMALVVPITSTERGSSFEVPIKTEKTKGVILCHQIKMIDYDARGVELIEDAPKDVLNATLRIVRALVQ